MAQAQARVAVINVVRPHPGANQGVNQFFHYIHAVVDPRQQNALVAQGDARVRQKRAGPAGFVGQFVGMVEMGVAPDRMVFFDHVA